MKTEKLFPHGCDDYEIGFCAYMDDDQVGVYTSNRNFIGRNGSKNAKVYITSPITAAMCTIEGKI